MRKALSWAGLAFSAVLLLLFGAYMWASHAAAAKLSRSFTAHEVDLPLPAPPTEASGEVATLGTAPVEGADPEGDAVARGRHLIESRYVCLECHGDDLSGGVMVDDPAMGRLLGPNLTSGQGSVTQGYTMADWDRIVRHGIRKDGKPAVMPSEDFVRMSDQELSDIVAYIRSLPPVDREVPPPSLGPIGKIMLASGKWHLSADMVEDHHADHAPEPPPAGETVEFGTHLAQVCTGCHRADLEGGPIVQGPPGWAPARNLTPHADGLAGWSFDQFATVMREGTRPDGTAVREPMAAVTPFSKNMTETELKALWLYLTSLPPRPTGD